MTLRSTPPPFADAAPLRTDADVDERVAALVGAAASDGTLWLLTVDGDRRQTPALVPIDDVPLRPDPRLVEGLGSVLAQLRPDLATDAGPGSVIFVLERRGPDDPTADDEAWADALNAVCGEAGVDAIGIHLSSPRGSRRLR